MINSRLLRAYRWFRSHPSGGIVGENARRCLDLARAECAARNADCSWEWTDDYNGWVELSANNFLCSCGCGHKIDRCEACILRDENGEALASLCGIWDADTDYRRIVQAELALEAMDYFTSAYQI